MQQQDSVTKGRCFHDAGDTVVNSNKPYVGICNKIGMQDTQRNVLMDLKYYFGAIHLMTVKDIFTVIAFFKYIPSGWKCVLA